MIKYVIKRDGREVEWNSEKVYNAVYKAMQNTESGIDISIINRIINKLEEKNVERMHVEDIQDFIEYELMKSSRKDVAKIYIAYRERRTIARKAQARNVFVEIMQAKNTDVTRENANMNADTPAGMMMKFASESTKPFVDDYLLSEPVKTAVRGNYIHIHDKDYYPTGSLTCVQHPLNRILKEGFRAGHGESRPAKRIETAAIIACISLETAQNEMHGGQAIPAFDFYLAPYVRLTFEEELNHLSKLFGDVLNMNELLLRPITDYIKRPLNKQLTSDDLFQHAINRTVDRVHQAMESFIHNMNTIHSRGGNQVVFSSINYGTDTSAEGRCIIRELLKTTYEGVGNGSTAIFPIQIWKKKRGVNFNPGDPNYDLFQEACKVSGRRFFPNFLNLDASYNKSEKWDANDPNRYMHEVATMGCRTRVFENRFGPVTSIGRGNLSFTTVNIVRLAIESTGNIDTFFKKLDDILDLTALQLHERFEFQKNTQARQFPFVIANLWNGGDVLEPNDTIESVINQGTLGIGFIGLAEALKALVGKHHGESDEAQNLGIRIITFFRDKVNTYCEKYKHNYSVLATPAEGLAGKFTIRDRKDFGVIEGVTDRDYYTNSNHVPVYYKCSPVHKARIEAPYHDLTRGGHIFYIEADGDAAKNPQAIMDLVAIMDKYNLGYGSINHNRNRCLDCGHEDAVENETDCPACNSEHIDTLQRITGYLVGTTDRWNSGKLAELKDRVTHTDVKE